MFNDVMKKWILGVVAMLMLAACDAPNKVCIMADDFGDK